MRIQFIHDQHHAFIAISNTTATTADHNLNGIIAQLPTGMLCFLDGDEYADDYNCELVSTRLKMAMTPMAPRAAPQIVLHGARGSGVTTQSRIIAKKWGLVQNFYFYLLL